MAKPVNAAELMNNKGTAPRAEADSIPPITLRIRPTRFQASVKVVKNSDGTEQHLINTVSLAYIPPVKLVGEDARKYGVPDGTVAAVNLYVPIGRLSLEDQRLAYRNWKKAMAAKKNKTQNAAVDASTLDTSDEDDGDE